jgi:hypothetical protein
MREQMTQIGAQILITALVTFWFGIVLLIRKHSQKRPR